MSESRSAGKVGLFVALGLILLVLLLMSFSKGLTILTRSYYLNLRAESVGGLKDRAAVLMSGITIGNVVHASIPPEGRGVIIRLRIQEQYKIHSDARFAIEQIGFLGDQYVAIYPTKNAKAVLGPEAEVTCEEPLNIQEVVRSVSSFIQGLNDTIKKVNEMVVRVDQALFSEQNLTNVSISLSSIRSASEKAAVMVDHINNLVDTNSRPISRTLTNLVLFSEELDRLAVEMQQAVSTNKVELTAAVKNIESISRILERMIKDVESGHGLAGAVMRDDRLRVDVRQIVENLSNLSSNLFKYGLLYKPRPPKTEKETGPPVYQGRSPF